MNINKVKLYSLVFVIMTNFLLFSPIADTKISEIRENPESSLNEYAINDLTVYREEILNTTIISRFANDSTMELVLRVDVRRVYGEQEEPLEIDDPIIPECGALPNYADDTAYEMVNIDNAFSYLEGHYDLYDPGEGVTVAVVDTGVYPHQSIMYLPDGTTIREIYYLDINFHREWTWVFWPFVGYWTYYLSAQNLLIDSYYDWTTYEDYEYDSTMKVGPYDGKSHGTSTTGALLRMAPYVNLIVVDYKDDSHYEGAYVYALEALNYFHNPDIVSCSWGFPTSIDGLEDAVEDLTDYYTTTIVASSGNDYSSTTLRYPAKYARGINWDVFSVGSVITRDETNEGDRSAFSNGGAQLNVVAPGQWVNVPLEGGGFGDLAGTSFSAPIVAGEFALMFQMWVADRGSSPRSSNLRNYLWPTCDPGGQDTDPDDTSFTWTRSDLYGYGIIDTWEALRYIYIN